MSILTAVKYQIGDSKRSLLIYYGIIYAIYTITIIATRVTNDMSSGSFTISGIELSSMIFIFVLGLNYFSESFGMFLQNGISRKTLFKSLAISIVPIAAFMAIVDSINTVLANLLINYEGMYTQFYHPRYTEAAGSGLQFFEGLLWYLTAYAMVAMIGFFITTLYYRMDRLQKLLISIGVPVTLVVILPIVDSIFTKGAILRGIGGFFNFAWGYQAGFNPYYSMVTCTLFFALFAGLTYLLIRRAVVKN